MVKPIKIAHIITSLEVGGAQAVLYDILVHLDTKKFEHCIFAFRDGPYRERFNNIGIVVYLVDPGLCIYDPLFLWRLIRLIQKYRPTLIHGLLWSANVLTRILGWLLTIPVVNVVHNNVSNHGRLRALIDDYTLCFSHTCVAVSKQVQDSLMSRHKVYANINLWVIENGIAVCAVPTYLSRSDLGLTSDHFIFGAVGRLELVKNYDLLLHGFKQVVQKMPHARLILVGSGSCQKALQDLASYLGIKEEVCFVGNKPAIDYYPLFDCFVQPSASEGISIALLEAMRAGCASIVTSQNGIHHVVTNEKDGLVVVPYDSDIFARAMMRIMYEDELRVLFSKNAICVIKSRFSNTSMIIAYENLFESIALSSALDRLF